jgi:hypothetical protein
MFHKHSIQKSILEGDWLLTRSTITTKSGCIKLNKFPLFVGRIHLYYFLWLSLHRILHHLLVRSSLIFDPFNSTSRKRISSFRQLFPSIFSLQEFSFETTTKIFTDSNFECFLTSFDRHRLIYDTSVDSVTLCVCAGSSWLWTCICVSLLLLSLIFTFFQFIHNRSPAVSCFCVSFISKPVAPVLQIKRHQYKK